MRRITTGSSRSLRSLGRPKVRPLNQTLGAKGMIGFNCTTCGQYHNELPMTLGSPAPALWYSITESERAERAELSSDQCIIDGQQFFILGQISIPIHNSIYPFTWLVWVSLSEENFNRASELWNVEGRESESAYFGWLQTALPYQPSTLSLKAQVKTQAIGERPLIEIEPSDHPLSLEHRHGITLQRVQQIAEAALHGSRT